MEKPKKQRLSADRIPADLVISICSRLPAKSIARFRCVSKEWSSTLRRRDFKDLHLKWSLSRRSLLFTFKLNRLSEAAMDIPEKQLLSETDDQTIPPKTIPIDLLISIFTKLPAKSVAKSRCVSKQWGSLLRRRDFTDLYLKMSSARPSLLFTFKLNGKFLFFSAPQPLNPHQDSAPLVAVRHMSFDTDDWSRGIAYAQPVRGFLCSKEKNPLVVNPTTGQCITLPTVASNFSGTSYLGYDPISKLFKVLRVSDDFRVLTLGNGEATWRTIECSITPFYADPSGICIDGTVYFLGSRYCIGIEDNTVLFYFDVRSETCKFLRVEGKISLCSTLVNFKGKLGAILPDGLTRFYSGNTTKLELWVLDDVEDEKWSVHVYELPPSWKSLVVVGNASLYIAGMTRAGEIVFSLAPYQVEDVPFCIYYYNVVRNTVVRVEIQFGMVIPKFDKIHTFVDHVEDVKLLEVLGMP
ncbi:unnamed protein product [Microthlaspi erraticum]|uniref:F-box domain-containing protein n=1 Tax=Microthlaspi erraticum TaxID=1685480 RepID=A0A6D2HP41_9BRAS|nr:unnamed protein product [Microthlaspi erraticum]CAA7022665.1 unnamed protein product [Microthlaspi erraticum]